MISIFDWRQPARKATPSLYCLSFLPLGDAKAFREDTEVYPERPECSSPSVMSKIVSRVQPAQAAALVLPVVHLNLLNPVPDFMTSRPQVAPSVPIPTAPSKRPTSFPQA